MTDYKAPFEQIAGHSELPLLLLCDHASNAIPSAYEGLGLDAATLARHVAYDIGAAGVTRKLAALLNVPAVLAGFSRLLIDPNRGADDPTLVMRVSDGAIIPGNANVDAAEIASRVKAYHAPYHQAVAGQLAVVPGSVPVILSIHSFTPVFKDHKRPWDCSILWDQDPRLAVPLMLALREEGLTVGDNEPYHGALKNDCMYTHGTLNGFPHALIELRQDLIESEEGQTEWAERLAGTLPKLLKNKELGRVVHFGSSV